MSESHHSHHTTLFVILSSIGILAAFFVGLIIFYIIRIQLGYDTPPEAPVAVRGFTNTQKNSTSIGVEEPRDMTPFIYRDSPKIGSETAPLTLVMFIDFSCPFCQATHGIITELQNTFGPELRIVMKHLPIITIHPEAGQQANAAQCAHAQGAFWSYYNRLFAETTPVSTDRLTAIGAELSLNMDEFTPCVTEMQQRTTIERDIVDAATLSVRGTPTYFLNGKRIEGVHTLEEWRILLLQELQTL